MPKTNDGFPEAMFLAEELFSMRYVKLWFRCGAPELPHESLYVLRNRKFFGAGQWLGGDVMQSTPTLHPVSRNASLII